MRVKIGNHWYDSSIQPICVEVTESEQRQISEMDRSIATHGRYAVFPDAEKTSAASKIAWMSEEKEPAL